MFTQSRVFYTVSVVILMLILLVSTTNAACATTVDTDVCGTCDSDTFGSSCTRYVREDIELLEWEEYAVCMLSFTFAVMSLHGLAYGYHFKLNHEDDSADSGADGKDDSAATATDAASSPAAGDGTKDGTAVEIKDEDDDGQAQEKKKKDGVRDKNKGSTAQNGGDNDELTQEESFAATGKKTNDPNGSSSPSKEENAREPYGRSTYNNRDQQHRNYTISPSRKRSAMYGAETDEVPSTELPHANEASQARHYGQQGGGRHNSVNHRSGSVTNIPVIAPPSQSRARSTRKELPPTSNPVSDPLAEGEAGHGHPTTGHRGFSTATDMHYGRSTSAAPFGHTPVPQWQQGGARSVSAADANGMMHTPRPLNGGGAGGGGGNLITLDCARPAQLQIDEGEGNNLRFNVTFLDGTNVAPSSAPVQSQQQQQQQPEEQPESTYSNAAETPREPPQQSPRGQQQQQQQPVEEPMEEEEFMAPPPVPQVPKFRKGDVIRRNALAQDVECDFGGFVGSMLCGEVACVQSVERYTNESQTFFSYLVVGGDRAPMVEMEELFTRVGEEPTAAE